MLPRYPKQLLVIIAEAALEKPLERDITRLGAHGYTIHDVRGQGSGGLREGRWEADRTVQFSVICEPAVAEEIAQHVMQTYAANYGVTLYFAPVDVLRPQKF